MLGKWLQFRVLGFSNQMQNFRVLRYMMDPEDGPPLKSPQIARLRVRGPFACFTRPEFKTERVSYDVMPPSAARGLLESILWRPQMRWVIRAIHVFAPIRHASVSRNEVPDQISLRAVKAAFRKGELPRPADVSRDRQQRHSRILRDVDYGLEAEIRLTERAGPQDSVAKFSAMFRRRMRKGQHFAQPYLGCREFAAEIMAFDEHAPPPVPESRDLGYMILDFDYTAGSPIPFRAVLTDGILRIPDQPPTSHPDAA